MITMLGSALGLGFLSGFRLYATLFALGLAIRFHWFTPNETMAAMTVFADVRVLALAGFLGAVEFLADKIPWVDSAWDSVHAFVRPVAAIAVAATALGSIDPVWKAVIALLSGGVALSTHSAKAATRFAVNHSPEPFSNWLLSAAEDLAAPLALWFISAHPGVFLGFLGVFMAVFGYVAPAMTRQLRVEAAALWTLLNRWAGSGPAIRSTLPKAALANPHARELWNLLYKYVGLVPGDIANKAGVSVGVRAVATKSLIGLYRSIGYLCFRDSKFTFLTRRWFRTMAHSIPYTDVKSVAIKTGFFMDQLVIEDTRGQQLAFDLFRSAPNAMTASLPATAATSTSEAGAASPSS